MAEIAIPLTMAFLIGGVPTLVAITLGAVMADVKKHAPEAFIFKEARKKDLPVLDLSDFAGRSVFLLGEKDAEGDINFKTDTFGMKLDASFSSGEAPASRYSKGLNIYHYSSTSWMPLGDETARAFKTVRRIFNQPKYNALHFLSFDEVCQLLKTPGSELEHDVEIFCQLHAPECDADDILDVDPTLATTLDLLKNIETLDTDPAISEDERERYKKARREVVIGALEELKREAQETPVEGGAFSYTAAFKANPIAYSAQDLQQFYLLILRKARQMSEFYDRLWNYVIMTLALMFGGLVAVFIALRVL